VGVSNVVFFRPSAFYFRQDLRTARTKTAARDLAFENVTELELLYQWTEEQGWATPAALGCTPAFTYRSRIQSGTRAEVIACGLDVIREHETLRSWLRETHNTIPPRWYISPSERRAKRRDGSQGDEVCQLSPKATGSEPAS